MVYRGLHGTIILTVINRLCRQLQVRLLKGNNSSCSVQDWQCTGDVMFWRVRLTGVAVERQQVTLLDRHVPTDSLRDSGVVMLSDFRINKFDLITVCDRSNILNGYCGMNIELLYGQPIVKTYV